MKKIINRLFVLSILSTASVFSVSAQNTAEKPDNYTAIRLIVTNEKDELLMRKTRFGWMTPAANYRSRQTPNEVLEDLAKSFGVTTSKPVLAGLFAYKYEFNERMSIRQFYVARYKEGNLIAPKGETVQWLRKDDALKNLRTMVASLAEMTQQVLKYPNTLWGGSFLLDRKDGKLTSKQIEGFYPLRGQVKTKK